MTCCRLLLIIGQGLKGTKQRYLERAKYLNLRQTDALQARTKDFDRRQRWIFVFREAIGMTSCHIVTAIRMTPRIDCIGASSESACTGRNRPVPVWLFVDLFRTIRHDDDEGGKRCCSATDWQSIDLFKLRSVVVQRFGPTQSTRVRALPPSLHPTYSV